MTATPFSWQENWGTIQEAEHYGSQTLRLQMSRALAQAFPLQAEIPMPFSPQYRAMMAVESPPVWL